MYEKQELLLRQMRTRALMIDEQPVNDRIKTDRAKVEEFKKLYFNAGRWSGGARDWTARKAFEEINRRERV